MACFNSHLNITLSGDEFVIDILKNKLESEEIFAHKLKTGVAYRSPAMRVIISEYLELMGELQQKYSRNLMVPMISTVTGKVIESQEVTRPEYWIDNLISPVLFNDALRTLAHISSKAKLGTSRSRTVYDLIEIGPHSALRRPCKDILEQVTRKKEIRYTSALERHKPSKQAILELVGKLFTHGYPISFSKAN